MLAAPSTPAMEAELTMARRDRPRAAATGLAQDMEDPFDVDADDHRHVVERVVLERGDEALDTGVVEDEVRDADLLDRGIEEGLDAGRVSDVTRHDEGWRVDGPARAFLPCPLEAFGSRGQVGDDDAGAGGDEPLRHGASEVPRAARHQRCMPTEVVGRAHAPVLPSASAAVRSRSPSGPKTWTGPSTSRKVRSPRVAAYSASVRTRSRMV